MVRKQKEPKTSDKNKNKKPAKLEPEANTDDEQEAQSEEDDGQNEDDKKQNEAVDGQNEEDHEPKSKRINKRKDKKEDITDQIDGQGRNTHNTFFVILALVVMVVASCRFNASSSKHKIDIELGLKQLTNDFQNQSQYNYKKLKSRMQSYVKHKTSPQPFVLMVASTKGNQHTAECFANRVAKLLTTATVMINGSKYSDALSDDAKQKIDVRLRDIFEKGKFPTAAIIHNLDSIPYGTTNLFYAYCDHDNPMYKEAAIIFTITLPQSYQISSNELDREGLVEKYLSEDSPWVKDSAFSMDVMGALISRITDTVIFVNKETEEDLEKSC